jgi:type I restriction-modification system DNA methylase subunit
VQAAPPVQTPPPAQQQSLGDAARKAREQQKNLPQAGKTYTNDDINAIHSTGISTVGQSTAPAPGSPNGAPGGAAGTPTAPDRKKMEADWRKKFMDARQKLALAQKDLDIMQRELSVLQVQYYPDPNQAMQQQHDRSDINEKMQKIEDKKTEVAKLEQAISDLQDDLRKAGGDPSWAY